MKKQKNVDDMMLVEARVKKIYYQCFNVIIRNEEFAFTVRTKRPPKDKINALVSFGNTMLYNEILRQMWQTSLNPQIGVIHATNRRKYSLHLDFADIFKPIIVDRVIFSIINGKQIKPEDFQEVENEGIFLSDKGKRIFIRAFEGKLDSRIVIKNSERTYRQLIGEQLKKYQKHISNGEKFKPYKYY